MNDRPNHSEQLKQPSRASRPKKSLTMLDLFLRVIATVSFAMFGVALALDADEMRSLTGHDEPVAAPVPSTAPTTPRRLAGDQESAHKMKTSAGKPAAPKRDALWQLDEDISKSQVVTAEVSDSTGRASIVPVAAVEPPVAPTPAGKSHVWSLVPQPTKNTATVTTKSGVAHVTRPAQVLPRKTVTQSTPSGRARVVSRQTVPVRSTISGRARLANQLPIAKAKSPSGKARLANMKQDLKPVASALPKPDSKPPQEFTLVLDNAPKKTVTVAKKTPAKNKTKRSKRPGQLPFIQHLAELYAPATTGSGTPAKKKTARTKVKQPQPIVASTDKNITKNEVAGVPVWELVDSPLRTQAKRKIVASNPKVVPLPQALIPPLPSIPQTPEKNVVKTTSGKSADDKTAIKIVEKKRAKPRFGLRAVVGKLFPPKRVRKKNTKIKTVASLDKTKRQVKDDSPAVKQTSGLKIPLLPLDETENQMAAADPVFDLVPIDQPDSPFRLPIVATRKQESKEGSVPPSPDGDEPKSDSDSLGYHGFKPVGELTVDISEDLGEDPKNLAAPEFDDIEPVVLDTTWIEQTLTAPTFPFYHQPLYFEDPNAERCGETWGFFQPAMSAAQFYLTIPALPYLIGAYPPNEEVESLGDCAYGCKYKFKDAYVPRFSWKGLALQGAATTGAIFLIP